MVADLVYLAAMFRHERLSRDALAALQLRRLRALLRHAWEQVPFYQKHFRDCEMHPRDVRRLSDLARLPITKKNDLRAAGMDQCLARGSDPSGRIVVRTSGSSGEPFAIALSPHEGRLRRLDGFRNLRSLGYRLGDRLVRLGPERDHHPPLLRHRLGLFASRTIASGQAIDRQIEQLRQARPTFLTAYPTVLQSIVDRLGGRLSAVARPRILVTGGEALGDRLRGTLEADLAVPIRSVYAAVETGAIAVECTTGNGFHVRADRILVELEGEHTLGPRPAIVTVLDAYTMPIIRYRLGDLLELDDRPCPCGSPFPLIRIALGPEWELVRLPDGSTRSGIPISHVLRAFPEIRQFRVIQDRLDHLTIQVTAAATLGEAIPAKIREQVEALCDGALRVDVEWVDQLPTLGWKSQVFVSRLNETGDGGPEGVAG